MKDYDVIIVGGGISGLSAGCFLAQEGFKVLLIEKQKKVGGYLSTFKRGDFKFEAATHYTYEGYPGGMVVRMLKMLKLENEIKLIRIGATQKTFSYFFPDFHLSLGWDKKEFVNTLCSFYPEEREGIKNYFTKIEEGFKKVMRIILERSIRLHSLNIKDYLKYENEEFCMKFDTVLKSISFDLLTKYFIREYIKNKKLASLLLFVPPIPNHIAFQTALTWWVDFMGLYIIEGGIDVLPKKLEDKFLKNNGKIMFNTTVEKILIDEKNKEVKGIITNKNEKIFSNYVILSIDPHQVFGKLIPLEIFPKEYKKNLNNKCVPSNFVVYLGISKNPKELGFNGESIYVFPDYETEKALEEINQGLWPNNNPIMIVTTSALENNDFAPKGKGVLIVHSTAPYEYFKHAYNKSLQIYKDIKEKLTDKVIDMIKRIIPNIKDIVLYREAATPLTFERFTSNYMGSIMGWMPTESPVLLSPLNSMKLPIKGLYMNGHWVYPGSGISNCLLGSYTLLKLIVKEMG